MERFDEWTNHIFNHPVTKPQWFFDADMDDDPGCTFIDKDDMEIVELLHSTFLHCSALPAKFSPEQIGQGLVYIFEAGCSNFSYALKNEKVTPQKRVEVLLSIKNIYKDIFNELCPSAMLANRAAENDLNFICYMLWDVSVFSYWEDMPGKDMYYQAVSEVMEYGLSLPNIACKESALHGLGHLYLYYPKRVEAIIGTFLQKEKKLAPEILQYAKQAMAGAVQ